MLKEELPLYRAKLPGLYASGGTGPGVGPGSYDLTSTYSSEPNYGVAPFGSTSARFTMLNSNVSPGVGTYNVKTENFRKGDVSIVPFASAVDRFLGPTADDVPGPGEYPHDGNRWGRTGRSHGVGISRFEDNDTPITGGPGSYNPNYSAAHRAHPRAAKFAGYSGRESVKYNDLPGPGHYDVSDSNKSIYSRKPAHMFATKTPRSMIGGESKNPGPGTYEIPSSFQSPTEFKALNPEQFSAFGSSAPRYLNNSRIGDPGPGSYTGEIAPRRPRIQWNGKGTSSFISESLRDTQPLGNNLGPGIYQAAKPTKQQRYQVASVPFRSTCGRFPVSKPVETDGIYEARHTVSRVPRRIHPARLRDDTFARTTGFKPVETLPDRVYDIKYDWPKPKCTSGAYLGTTPRFTDQDMNKTFPGPGHYNISDKGIPYVGKSLNGTWGNDGRFKNETKGTPGPGQYWYDSTLFKKTFNCTIASTDDLFLK